MRTDLYTRTLRDVDATLPADGEVLAWDVDLGKYVPTGVDALVTPAPEVDLTDIVILDHTANAFRVREGSNNYIHVNTTNGSESLALGNATTNPSFSLLGTGALLWNAARQITLPDNTANVIRLMEGSNEYFGVSTTNGSEAVRFGNTNTNPSFAFSGSGALTLPTGHITVPDNTATAFRVRESTNNYLAITTTNGSEAITLGNASTNPDVELLGEGAFIMLGRFAVDSNYTYSVLPLLLGRGPSAATPQDGTILVEGGSGTDVAGATLHYYAGVATGDAESGTHAFYNSVRGTSGTAAQDSRPNNIFAGDRRLLRTHGDGNDTVLQRNASTSEFTLYGESTEDAAEAGGEAELILLGTLPVDVTEMAVGSVTGTVRYNGIGYGWDSMEEEYTLNITSGEAAFHVLVLNGTPFFDGLEPNIYVPRNVYAFDPQHTLPTVAEDTDDDFFSAPLWFAWNATDSVIEVYAGLLGTSSSDAPGRLVCDFRMHTIHSGTYTSGGGTPPTITSFTVDVTGAGSPGGTASCRGGVDTLDFAWTATGDPTITYSIDQGVGTVSGGSETGVASVEGVTVYTLTATNSAGSDTATVTVTGVRQVITSYTWYRSLRGSALSGSSWPYEEAGFDTITAKGSNATGGQSTTGLTALALPAGLVNQAVEPATATSTEGYGDSSTAGNGNQFPTSTSRWHSRLLVRPTNLTNARFFWQMYFNGSNFVSVQYVSSGNTLRVTGSRTAGGFTADSAGALSNDTWHIIDVTYSNNEGPSGQAELRVYVGGALTATWNGAAGAFASFDATTTLFGLMGTRAGLSTQQGRYLFWGVRALDSINDFTLADHQADAEALGLYTP